MGKALNRFFKIFFSVVLIIAQLQFIYLNVSAATAIPLNIKSALNVSLKSSSISKDAFVTLRWMEDKASKRGYYIQRKIDTGDFIQVNSAVVPPNTSYPAAAPIYYNLMQDYISDTTGHIYTYRIIAVDNSGNTSVYSNEVSFSTKDVVEPNTFILTPISETQIDLAWTYPTGSFNTVIERRRAEGTDTSWHEIATVPKKTLKYRDVNLIQNTKYYYRIRAMADPSVDSYRCSGKVNGIITYTADPYNLLPGINEYTNISSPTNLYGYVLESDTEGLNSIKLTWTNNSPGTKTEILRKKRDDQDFTLIATVNNDIATYKDDNVLPNTWYIYKIRALVPDTTTEPARRSADSEELTIIGNFLKEPTELTVITNSDNNVELNWVDNTENETGFEIWRKSGATGTWANYASVGSRVIRFVDRNTATDILYFYKVRVVNINTGAFSAFSNEAKTWATIINPPTELYASSQAAGSIDINWKDNSNNETAFAIERKDSLEGPWKTLDDSLPPGTTSYTDWDLSDNTQYYYRIKVYENVFYNSYSYSETLSVYSTLPTAPIRLTGKVSATSIVELNWVDTSWNETGFVLERKKGKNGDYEELSQLDVNSTNYVDESISEDESNYEEESNTKDVKYYYRVRAVYDDRYSDYSKEVMVIIRPTQKFKDIKVGYWGKEPIDSLAEAGVFGTATNTNFYPEAMVTRGEFTNYLVKAFKLKAIAVGSFTDVKVNHKYYKQIMIANQLGIITQNKGKYFYPDRFITREEMAVLTVKVLKIVEKPLPAHDVDILNAYPDKASVSSWALNSLASVIGEKVMLGKESKGYLLIAPKTIGTRVEAAWLIYRAIGN